MKLKKKKRKNPLRQEIFTLSSAGFIESYSLPSDEATNSLSMKH